MRLTGSLLVLLLLSACIPGSVIRHLPRYVTNDPFHKQYPVESIPNYPNTKIAYIELDDMGDLWSDNQISKAEEMIRQANNRAAAAGAGAIVLTYVHGWHQNSNPKNTTTSSNLEMFKRILGWTAYDEIVAARSSSSPRPERPVIGVYIGWRGITGYWPLDYYNRHKAAGRVAGSAATEALLRVTTAARENLRTRSIVVGHSMGGLIVEHSLIPALDAYLLKLKGVGPRPQCEVEASRKYLPADLIVLINPASHAMEAQKFIGTLRRLQVELQPPSQDQGFFNDNEPWPLPLLVSVTSESDSATRVLLNFAAYPMTINRAFRSYPKSSYRGKALSQRDLSLHTAGNFEPLASHWVRHERLTAGGQTEVKPCTTFDGWRNDFSPHRPEDQIPLGDPHKSIFYKTLCFDSIDSQGGDRFWILQKRQSLNSVQPSQQSKPSPIG